MPRAAFRLPEDLRPSTVDLALEVDPAKSARFRGEVRHRVHAGRARNRFVLHAAELTLRKAWIEVDGTRVACTITARPDDEVVVLESARRVPAGDCTIVCRFAGRLRDDLRGLYRASSGPHRYAISQLAATHARRVFPCFDEPAFKAAFQVSITTGAAHQVLANEPLARRETNPDGRVTHHFERTPPLSSYLVAFAIGAFEGSKRVFVGDTPIRVWAPPGRKGLAAFALDAAQAGLSRLERYFGSPHPYRKCDLIAVPDFEFGAMENAGAVFFREAALLLDPKRANAAEKKRVAEVVVHELSHMWFGNLVTMDWWDDLWLNESFATWISIQTLDEWRPEWQVWRDFQAGRLAAMEMDALDDTHPVYTTVRHPDEATANFDLITYQKGASIVRMLERIAGSATFRRGVRSYIEAHREGNAVAADLWSALSDAAGRDLAPLVRGWIETPGHPVVSVARRGRRLRLQQAPMRADGRDHATPRWPIVWQGRQGRTRIEARWAGARSAVTLPKQKGLVVSNDDEAAFFRSELHADLFAETTRSWLRLRPLERCALVDHEWALARAGRVRVERFLDLLAPLASEPDPQVLATALRPLGVIDGDLAEHAGCGDPLRTLLRDRFAPALAELGFRPRRGESDDERDRRAMLWRIVGGLGRDAVALDAASAATERILAGGRVDPSLQDVVVALAASRGDATRHAAYERAWRNAETPQARRRFLLALADFPGAAEARRTLRLARGREVASGDVAVLLVRSLSNPASRELAWREIQAHWKPLSARMGAMLVTRVIDALPLLARASARSEVQRFFRAHPVPTGRRALRQALQRFTLDAGFRKRAAPALSRWLAAHSTENA